MKQSDVIQAAKNKLNAAEKHSPGRSAADQAAVIKQFGLDPGKFSVLSVLRAHLSIEHHKAVIEEQGLKPGVQVSHKKYGPSTLASIKTDYTLLIEPAQGLVRNVSCSPSDVRKL